MVAVESHPSLSSMLLLCCSTTDLKIRINKELLFCLCFGRPGGPT